jgi:hypothetical protein
LLVVVAVEGAVSAMFAIALSVNLAVENGWRRAACSYSYGTL